MLYSPFHKFKFLGLSVPIPIFFIFIILLILLYLNMSSTNPVATAQQEQDFHYKYTIQKGYFAQSESSTNDEEFDFKKEHFGLLSTDWPTFTQTLKDMQDSAKEGESYKLLFLGRHGEGVHNVAEAKYGTKAWDCYYSALPGLDNLTWFDALLTPLGQSQALSAHSLWSSELPLGIPPPETYYVSPLTRAIQTANLTFQSLPLPPSTPYRAMVKELLREALGIHTCDARHTRSHIQTSFPHLSFESNFSEEDLLWEKNYREPTSARDYRLSLFLDDIFSSDEGVVISMTSHSGAIGSMLRVLGHRDFKLETGGVIPVLVRGERVEGKRPVPPWEPSDSPPMCDEPPL